MARYLKNYQNAIKISRIFFLWAVIFQLISPASFCVAADSLTDPGFTLASGGDKISLDLKGIDIVEALKILSNRGNLNMVIDGNVQGRVTLFLKDVDIQDALEIVLISAGLAYEKKSGIIYVMTQGQYTQIYGESFGGEKQVKIFHLINAKAANLAKSLEQTKTHAGKLIVDDASNSLVVMDSAKTIKQLEQIVEKLDQPATSRIFELKYAKAETLKDKVSAMLTKDVGILEIDTRTNKLAVTDTPSRMDEIQKMVTAFDEKPQQVLIEAKIVQITLTDQYKLGVDWKGVFTKLQKDYSFRSNFAVAGSLENPGTFPTGFTNGAEAVVGTFGMDDYTMLVQALKTVGDTNLLSSPRITAINNEEAKILVGESRPYATNTVVSPSGGATTTASTLSFLDIGIKLYVTPSISADGFITMKIRPEVSSSTDNYTYGDPATTVPIVSTTQAETSIRVKDGNTIIIAGLIKDERAKSISKLPMAGDIPILGHLFKKTDKQVTKQELVIFITSHIISGETNYLEVPESPTINQDKFTVSETHAFERREPQKMDPDYFKRETDSNISSDGGSNIPSGHSLTKLSVPHSAEEYYYGLKDKILSHMFWDESKKGKSPEKGNIQISFRLSSNGQLMSGPYVVRCSNEELIGPAVDAVRSAAPYEAFPASIAQTEKDFTMDFIFE